MTIYSTFNYFNVYNYIFARFYKIVIKHCYYYYILGFSECGYTLYILGFSECMGLMHVHMFGYFSGNSNAGAEV